MPFLLVAICIDGFQFLISLALSVVAVLPGTVLGCATGAYFAGEVGCAIVGALGSLPFINGPLTQASGPIGTVLGIVISICISFTLGSILILFLQLFGILDKKAALMAYMGEVLPGLNILPAWTALVVRCGINEMKKEASDGVLNTVVSIGSKLVLPNTPIGTAIQAGTLIGSRGLAKEMSREELKELRSASAQKNLPMQDVRLSPTPYAKTS